MDERFDYANEWVPAAGASPVNQYDYGICFPPPCQTWWGGIQTLAVPGDIEGDNYDSPWGIATTQAVPEPSTLTLLVSALLGVAFYLRRRA